MFPIQISLSKSEVHGKTFYVSIVRDITERKRKDDELEIEQQRSEVGSE